MKTLRAGWGRARACPGVMTMAAGAAVSIAMLASPAAAQFVWTGTTGGNFNDPTKWQGGIAPSNLTDPTTTLTFTGGNLAAITATQNIGSPFQVNAFTFTNAGAFTVAGSPTTNAFQMVGAAPVFNMAGLGASTISAPIQLTADTTFGGSGLGNLTLGGAISGTGRLTIPSLSAGLQGTPASRLFHTVTIGGGVSSYTGGLFLDGGNMQTAGFGATTFGPAGSTFTVTSNGGTLQLNSNQSNGVAASTFQLDGTLRVLTSTGGNLPLATASTQTLLSGAGSLVYSGINGTGMTISGNSTGYTGAILIDRSDLPQYNGNTGGIVISGANGAVVNVPSIDIRAGGTLSLTSTATAFNSNRIGDSTPINLRSGNFTLSGATAANFGETVGAITGGGYSTITASPGASGNSTLTSASLAREDRGTFLFRGTALGGTAATRGNVVFTSAPTGDLVGGGGAAGTTSISILPYAIGDTAVGGTGTSLVTYDSNGVRPLNTTTEYAPDLASGTATNARLTAATANAGNTVNALAIATGGSVIGSGPLGITSGVILNTSTTGSIGAGNTVSFGSAEGQVFTAGGTSVLTVAGDFSGSNGLTKSGGGTLTLTGDNSGLTGQLTINAGYINFNSAAALPGTGQIVANGVGGGASANAAGLTYSGASPLDLSRDIFVNSGFLNARCAAAGQSLTLSGRITGEGGLFIETPAGSDVYLTGTNNTYTGVTYINGGNVHINSDANLGNGGAVDMTSTLTLEGDWVTSRMVNFNSGGTATFNTNGFNATLNGPMTSYTTAFTTQTAGTLVKTGAGTLDITSDVNTFGGALTVNGGTVLINGTIPASLTAAITVNSGATLGGSGTAYRNVTVAAGGTLSPGNSAGVLTQHGNLTLASGSTFLAELNGNTPGNGAGNHDQYVVNGLVTLTDASLALSLGYLPSSSDVLFILTNDGTEAISGTFAGLDEGASVTLGTWGSTLFTATISYQGDAASGAITGGNDVVLYNVIPAPGAAAVLAIGGLATARRRRR